jgi:hypothetical protein
MTLLSQSLPTGHATFCDDIRQEDNGKHLLIGVYNSVMYVPQFPFVALKMCFRIRYVERPNDASQPVQFRIFLPGAKPDNPALTWDIPTENRPVPSEQELQAQVEWLQSLSGEGWETPEPTYVQMYNLTLTPLIISQEGAIRVRAYRGDDVIRIGSMLVRTRPPDDPPPA